MRLVKEVVGFEGKLVWGSSKADGITRKAGSSWVAARQGCRNVSNTA